MAELSGQVTDAGTSVSGAQVFVVDTNGSTNPADWTVAGGDTTDANGDWSVTGLVADATERYHAVVQYEDGGGFYNAESLPYLSTPGIPDSGDLHARYDATELSLNDGDPVSTWGDATGNGYALTEGAAPQYVASGLNGNPVVRFDGVDDFLTTTFSALSQPNSIFIVAQSQAAGETTSNKNVHASTNGSNTHALYVDNTSPVTWNMFAGSNLNSGVTEDENPHVFGELFNTTSSALRIDGTEAVSGDVGSQSLDGLTIGTNASQSNFGDFDIGEILVYPQDKSGIASDVESYLSGKWGITI